MSIRIRSGINKRLKDFTKYEQSLIYCDLLNSNRSVCLFTSHYFISVRRKQNVSLFWKLFKFVENEKLITDLVSACCRRDRCCCCRCSCWLLHYNVDAGNSLETNDTGREEFKYVHKIIKENVCAMGENTFLMHLFTWFELKWALEMIFIRNLK